MKEGQEQGALTMELDSETMAYTYFALIEGLVTEVVFFIHQKKLVNKQRSLGAYIGGELEHSDTSLAA